MIHLGDITKISGYTAPIVDCIIGGSPCQDLSIAGKRAGLDGERSGLFMEQIRIIKEMRKRNANNGTTDIRPRYMVWENVPGAFSSNKGEDFRIVLEETAKVADENAVIPEPPKGKWTTSGCIMGDGWSIAWRVLDAQFWGVPQRRRRIALVADFGGQSAQEILFVRKGVSGDTEQGKQKRKNSTEDASGCIGTTDCIGADLYNQTITGDKAATLSAFSCMTATRNGPSILQPIGVNCGMSHGRQCVLEPVPYTLKVRGGCEGGGKGALVQTDKSATLSTLQDQTLFQPIISLDRASFNQGKNAQFDFEVSDKGINSPIVAKGPSAVCYAVDQGGGKSACNVTEGQSPTLTCTHGGEPAVCYCMHDQQAEMIASYVDTTHADDVVRMDDVVAPLQARDYKGGKLIAAIDCRNGTEDAVNGALQSNMAHSLNGNNVVRTHYTVRRLTPLECERLQGFPDGWTDIGDWTDTNGKVRKTSDAARYKALGNSIALPPWKWVIKRLCACYERDATMASLFDGISGFVLLWTQLNGLGSVKWTSEIEDFPIAVCKKHFGDKATGDKGDFYEAVLGRNQT